MIRVSRILPKLPLAAVAAVLAVAALAACSPEVGSKEWCEDLKKKPKGEWTANEAGNFAKHCVL
ncbi:MAG: DUF3012 domain-containing protein [Rhodospirillales bacterium CG15_BIG_FIL_POST_REV_8_21_14_020_66_15]|nr:MAG: DUF3012 domain-containing protein [Rhodospirillales bacterium CG15_BIG_FIL_POST_REV_8_21_14_020_66_15]